MNNIPYYLFGRISQKYDRPGITDVKVWCLWVLAFQPLIYEIIVTNVQNTNLLPVFCSVTK